MRATPHLAWVTAPPTAVVAMTQEANAAAYGLLQAMYLYGIAKPRGWSTPIFEALKVLHPEAAAHLSEHEDPEATMRKFWPQSLAED